MQIRKLRGRGSTYSLLLGAVAGMLVTGLAIPFLFGERASDSTVASAGIDNDTFGPLSNGDTATGDAAAGGSSGGDAPAGIDGGATTNADASPSGSGSAPTGGGPASATPSGGDATVSNRGATDQGVTADSVKIGVYIADTGSLNELGFGLEIAEQRPYEVYLEALNERGGIHGRKVEAVYILYDPLDQADLRRACVAAAEDHKVFATLNLAGFYGPAVTCLTEEYGVPLLNYSAEPDEWYRGGRFFTFGMSMTRVLKSLVAELDRVGELKDKKIGILDSEFPTSKLVSENALLPELAKRGYTVTYRCPLSADRAEAQGQMPICIQQMQARGVNAVIFNQGYINTTIFLRQAESAGFQPKWYNSDAAGATVDAFTANMPRSYQGALAVTGTNTGEDLIGRPEPPTQADCHRRWTQLTGEKMERRGDARYVAVVICSLVDGLEYALNGAGPNLTRDSYANALVNRGEFGASGIIRNTFRPGKYTSTDAVRFVRWYYDYEGHPECKCWVPVSDPVTAPY